MNLVLRQLAKKPSSRSRKIQEKRSLLRASIFTNIDEAMIWQPKKGYTTIPRGMPLLLTIMDALSGKGKPVSSTYLELWCRAYEDGFVTLSKQNDIAFASGFSGQRAVSSWKERIRRLRTLGFVEVQPGPSGEFSYALLWNPYQVVKRHRDSDTAGFPKQRFNALVERATEIGADDLA